jgi:hypothetical protein
MLQCLLSFFVGGGLLAFVTFVAQKGNATLTVMVANIPVMFLLNVLSTYRVGGVDGSLNFAKGALMLFALLHNLCADYHVADSSPGFACCPVTWYTSICIAGDNQAVESTNQYASQVKPYCCPTGRSRLPGRSNRQPQRRCRLKKI